MAKSTTRPLVTAGPIGRHGSSDSLAESALNVEGVVLADGAACPRTVAATDTRSAIASAGRMVLFGMWEIVDRIISFAVEWLPSVMDSRAMP
jgi:hypothetical protein